MQDNIYLHFYHATLIDNTISPRNVFIEPDALNFI